VIPGSEAGSVIDRTVWEGGKALGGARGGGSCQSHHGLAAPNAVLVLASSLHDGLPVVPAAAIGFLRKGADVRFGLFMIPRQSTAPL
jgi:hypothetical protein